MKKISFSGKSSHYEITLMQRLHTHEVEKLTDSLTARGYTGVVAQNTEKTLWEEAGEEMKSEVYVLTKSNSDGKNPVPIGGSLSHAAVEAFRIGLTFTSSEADRYKVESVTAPV